MSALLFKLRNVPEDEADDIRQLLSENNIDIYETNAGNWGISMPALWVQNEQQLQQAKNLINEYQIKRSTEARQHYNDSLATGNAPGLFEKFMQRPFASTGIILFCLFVLYAMISPFVRLALNS